MQKEYQKTDSLGNVIKLEHCDGFSMLDFVYSKNIDFVDGTMAHGYSTMPSDANLLKLI